MPSLKRLILMVICAVGISAHAASQADSGATATSPGRPTARSTWGAYLNPGGEIPVGSFKAFYINTKNPKTVVASETVDDIAVQYPFKAFNDIPSEDFGAYWVGKLKFAKDEMRLIKVGQSWAKSRIVVDGEIVFEGSNNERRQFEFTKGIHLVEVEYINNWHTTGFRVVFDPQTEAVVTASVGDLLAQRGIRNPEIHFVGVYESKSKDAAIQLYPARNLKNVVLVLSSYDSVKWVVNEPERSNIRAILYSSVNPATNVVGKGLEKTLVFPLDQRIGSYDFKPRCSCTAGTFHCENASGSLISTKNAVEKVTGGHLASASGSYYGETFVIPGSAVTQSSLASVADELQAQKQQREACKREGDPDFENMDSR